LITGPEHLKHQYFLGRYIPLFCQNYTADRKLHSNINTYFPVYVFVEMLPLITEICSVIMYKLAIFTTYQLLCWTELFYHLHSTNVIITHTWHAALDVQNYALFGQLK